jgi:hypothetical protein
MYINTKQLHATAWRSARVIGHNLLHGDAVGQSGTARTGTGSAVPSWGARGDRPGSGQWHWFQVPARCATGIMIKIEALGAA